ncbi:DUF4833 domain-containing protein [Albibacterium bauzanense]|uniref:Uncharacterized protein DUF4833 n=1 Tax=Albibacterium bauzanense TaxID=653929 RepID=A0A4R1LZ61_9SPHI|nr:DUF4833 domain-containing protein [Albibacterium bauzanense]TCK82653.1 uncharacterized protein DUF4833 [Albibacterium bauzanense]
MRKSIISISFLVGLMVLSINIAAQETGDQSFDKLVDKESLPVPAEKDQLFYLQRDPNSNTVIYSINLEDGELDTSRPVKAHWIRYSEGSKRTNLSFIQRTMAYGVHHTKVEDGKFDIRIQAYKDLPIEVRYNKQSKKYQAYTLVENKEIVLERIFVRINGGSLFKPKVEYIEVSGYNPTSNAKINHRFQP